VCSFPFSSSRKWNIVKPSHIGIRTSGEDGWAGEELRIAMLVSRVARHWSWSKANVHLDTQNGIYVMRNSCLRYLCQFADTTPHFTETSIDQQRNPCAPRYVCTSSMIREHGHQRWQTQQNPPKSSHSTLTRHLTTRTLRYASKRSGTPPLALALENVQRPQK